MLVLELQLRALLNIMSCLGRPVWLMWLLLLCRLGLMLSIGPGLSVKRMPTSCLGTMSQLDHSQQPSYIQGVQWFHWFVAVLMLE